MTSDRSDRLLEAGVAAGVVVVGATEGLSLAGWFDSLGAGLVGVVGLAVATWTFRRGGWPSLSPRPGDWGLAGWVVAVVMAVTLLVAVAAAPNTWDSMTYHLTRVEHWLSLGSVHHYPTSIDRQVWQPPFGEYLLASAKALGGGGDRLVNLVQWLALGGSILAAGRITRSVAGDSAAAGLAAVLVATLPSAVLQATSTQNDLLVGSWLLAALAFALRLDPGRERANPLWFGAALALAIGTKGTAVVFGMPLVALVGVRAWRLAGLAAAARTLALAGTVVLLCNAPWMIRNQATFGSPLGDRVAQGLLRPASLAPAIIASNLVAQASVHWGTPEGLGDRLGSAVLTGANRLLGVDPATAYPYFGGLRVVPWSTDEDQVGAPLFFLLLLGAMGLAIRHRGRVGGPARDLWWLGCAGAMLLAATVRWQPYGARLQLPGLLLVVPVVALAWSRWSPAVIGLAAAVAVAPLVGNQTRPLLPVLNPLGAGSVLVAERTAQYFVRRPTERAGYQGAIDRLRAEGCRWVGVKSGYDSWEYPLWALGRVGGVAIEFRQVEVANPTALVVRAPEPLCAIVALDQSLDWRPNGESGGWRLAGREGRIALWLPEPGAR